MKIQRRFWAWLLLVLFLPLPLIMYVQYKQFGLLDEVARTQIDSVTWQTFQLEKEHMRLVHALHQSIDDADYISNEEVLKRYEVYVSRVELVRNSARKGLFDDQSTAEYVLGRLDSLVSIYDDRMADPQSFRLESAEVNRMISRLSELSKSADQAALSPSPRSLRILVAEDHPINLKYMRIVMAKLGHETVFCVNGREAVDLVQKEHFDLLLLDYHMPEMDGIIATRLIRALPDPCAHVPIVLLTADVVGDAERRAFDSGVNEFLTKPLQASQFVELFDRLFGAEASGKATDLDGN